MTTMITTLLSFVVALFLVEVSAMAKGPAIAMECGKTNMYHDSETGQWMPDKGGAGCIKDAAKILEYCRQVYPDRNITNIFLSGEHVTINNWCKDGKVAHCRGHSRSVYPYYCINAEFKGHALKVPSVCEFESQKKSCRDQTSWIETARSKCDEKGMKLINRYSVQRPCHSKTPGLYRAFQFVCCPVDYEESIPTNLKISPLLELGPVIIEDKPDHCSLAPEVGNCRASFQMWFYNSATDDCQLFTFGGCGGNDNRFNSKTQCLSSCGSSGAAAAKKETTTTTTLAPTTTTTTTTPEDLPLEDICFLPRKVGHCRALIPMWYFDAESGSCKTFNFGGCGGNENQFEQFEDCIEKCGQYIRNDPETTTEEEEVVETTAVPDMQLVTIPPQIQLKLDEEHDYYIKLRNNEIEKYEQLKNESALEPGSLLEAWKADHDAQHNKALREITEIHLILFDELMAQARTSLYDDFQSQASAIEPNRDQLVFSLKQYVMSEKMDQQQCQEYYDFLMSDYQQVFKSEQVYHDTSEMIETLQDRVDTIQKRLETNILSVQGDLRESIRDDIVEAVRNMGPVKFETVTLETVEVDDNDDEEEYDDLNENGFDDYQESGNDWYSEHPPIDTRLDAEAGLDLSDGNHKTLGAIGENDDISFAGHSWPLYMFWVVVFLIAALVVVFIVRISTTKRRKAQKKKRSAQHQQVNKTLTPEERQLLQMQQNGFENPTYKFFEKHQVA